MNTKLTLSLNKEVIEKAKAYTKSKGISLSKLVEDMLTGIINMEQDENPESKEIHPTLQKMSGSLKMKNDHLSYKQLRDIHYKNIQSGGQ